MNVHVCVCKWDVGREGCLEGGRGDVVCLTLCSILPTLSPSTLSNGTAVMSMQEILAALSLK